MSGDSGGTSHGQQALQRSQGLLPVWLKACGKTGHIAILHSFF